MGKMIKKNIKNRLLICVAVLILSLLFIGAGKVTQELSGRKDSRKVENTRWGEILSDMVAEIPAEHKAEWKEITSEKPESLMNAISITKR